jgi:hypothetical protein
MNRFGYRCTPVRGSVLLVVVGLAAVLLGLVLSFLVRMRSEVEQAKTFASEAQTRTLIAAACMYVQETGRIGWGEESFGWRDIRDGSNPSSLPGPRGRDGRQLPKRANGSWAIDPLAPPLLRWPAIGGIARCPAFLPILPPWATKGRYAYNPVQRRAWNPATDPEAAGYVQGSMPALRYNNLSPQASVFPDAEPSGAWRWDDGTAGQSSHAVAWASFAAGARADSSDPASLRSQSGTLTGWFRVCRTSVDTFIVSAGSGATRGFRSWQEVVECGEQAGFFNQPSLFDELLAEDRVLWYEICWTAAAGTRSFARYAGQLAAKHEDTSNAQRLAPPPWGFELLPHGYNTAGTLLLNEADNKPYSTSFGMTRSNGGQNSPLPVASVNQVGSLAWIRRLYQEPPQW